MHETDKYTRTYNTQTLPLSSNSGPILAQGTDMLQFFVQSAHVSRPNLAVKPDTTKKILKSQSPSKKILKSQSPSKSTVQKSQKSVYRLLLRMGAYSLGHMDHFFFFGEWAPIHGCPRHTHAHARTRTHTHAHTQTHGVDALFVAWSIGLVLHVKHDEHGAIRGHGCTPGHHALGVKRSFLYIHI